MMEVWRRLTSLLSTSSPSCSILTRSYDVAALESGGCSNSNSANCATTPLNTSSDRSCDGEPASTQRRNRLRERYRAHVEDWRVWLVIAIILSALIALILFSVLLPILRHHSPPDRSREEYTTPFTVTRGTTSTSTSTLATPPSDAGRKAATVEPVVFFENRLEGIFPTLSAETKGRVVATMDEDGEKWGKTEAATNATTLPTTVKPVSAASSSAPVEEDEDDLFWMKLPPKVKATTQSTTVGDTAIQRGVAMAEAERKRIVDEELKQVIASLENDHSPPPPAAIDYSVLKGGKASDAYIDDIKPVEISFTPPLDDVAQSKEPTPSANTAETGVPVWRRLPPPSVALDVDSLPSPPPPPRDSSATPIKEPFKVSAFLHSPSHSIPIPHDPRHDAPVVVTALLDIGRSEWLRFTRHFDQYLDYFKMLFRLDNYMIIYCDAKVSEFLHAQSGLDWSRIQLVEITLADLPFYRWRNEIQAILDEEQGNWNEEWDKSVKEHPEALYADYNVLVNSKPYLLDNATKISKFSGNGFFVWLDAGYGHGSAGAIPRGLWRPSLVPGKITLLKVTSAMERVERYSLGMVYRKQKSVVSGGFMAGDVSAISRYHVFFVKTFMDLLDIRRVDDDQTTLLMTIHHYHSAFNVLHGGWFDAFKLLPSQSN